MKGVKSFDNLNDRTGKKQKRNPLVQGQCHEKRRRNQMSG
jgi:hypothetical protein